MLLVVTNWFFHKVYWSEWIGRFNRRRKVLEQVDRMGFISGQTAGFLLLGLTSVYREGFETVLFLQNLQVTAGTGATLLGIGFGLAATTVVGVTTFALERKLPYRRMLIATGVLIGLVLGIMVGTTVHNLQGPGVDPDHSDQLPHQPRAGAVAGAVRQLAGAPRAVGRATGRLWLLRCRSPVAVPPPAKGDPAHESSDGRPRATRGGRFGIDLTLPRCGGGARAQSR